MKIAIAADELTGIASVLVDALQSRGHEVLAHGVFAEQERDDWAWASEAAARDVACGYAEQAIVCCWTGTGASIAARSDVESAVLDAHRRRRRNQGKAAWKIVIGHMVIVYEHPDGEDSSTARVVTVWRR